MKKSSYTLLILLLFSCSKNTLSSTKITKNIAVQKPIKPIPSIINKSQKKIININTNKTIEKKRIIKITNAITDLMVTYTSHWAKPAPSKFILNSQNKLLPQHKTQELEVIDNKLQLSYEVEFKKFGILYHHEHRLVDFEIPPDNDAITITFDWYNDYRLSLNNGKPIQLTKFDSAKKTKK